MSAPPNGLQIGEGESGYKWGARPPKSPLKRDTSKGFIVYDERHQELADGDMKGHVQDLKRSLVGHADASKKHVQGLK